MNYQDLENKLRDEFSSILESDLTEDRAKRAVEIIRLLSDDDERAHSMEDNLREKILKTIDHPLAEIALSTGLIRFARWYA